MLVSFVKISDGKMNFHTLEIAQIEKTTADCSVVTFIVPKELKPYFEFTQGQYLTFKTNLNGEEIRRSYSICSGPLDDHLSVAIKKIEGGLFSSFANDELQVGDTLDVSSPDGKFYVKSDSSTKKHYAAFGAGSGITPLLSIAKAHLSQEPKSTFKLFYLSSTSRTIILKEEIEALKNQFLGRFEVFYFLSREKRDIEFLNGRFTPNKIQQLFKTVINGNHTDYIFLCGPKEMVFMIRDEAIKLGLENKQILFELFFTGNAAGSIPVKQNIIKKAEGSVVTLIDGGKDFSFVMTEEHDNILDAALLLGADLPFACKGGVCSTCKCKVLEGEVKMKINYALEEEEVKNNFVLSCQAVPTSEKVVVDFDV